MTGRLDTALQDELEKITGERILESHYLSGGDINQARKVVTTGGRYFLKFNSGATAADNLRSEADGLRALAAPMAIKTPQVIACGSAGHLAFLLLEFIEPSRPDAQSWVTLARQLSDLHNCTSGSFGFHRDNYIGSLPQSNTHHDNWVDFFRAERLIPQWNTSSGFFDTATHRTWDAFLKNLDQVLTGDQPELVHGDMWSGNVMFCGGEPVLIDPSVSYAHGEMDLAMSKLFGGFAGGFYAEYEAMHKRPPGLSERLEIYQLYYLLVHVNLFGAGYVRQSAAVINKFGK